MSFQNFRNNVRSNQTNYYNKPEENSPSSSTQKRGYFQAINDNRQQPKFEAEENWDDDNVQVIPKREESIETNANKRPNLNMNIAQVVDEWCEEETPIQKAPENGNFPNPGRFAGRGFLRADGSSGFGRGRPSINSFSGSQQSSGFDNTQSKGFGGVPTNSGFGTTQSSVSDNTQSRGFDNNQSRGFGGNRNSGFDNNQSRGFGGNRNSGFDNNQSRGFGGRNNGFGHNQNNNFGSSNKNDESQDTPAEKPKIDWNAIRALPDQDLSKFKDHPAVVKNFYNEPQSLKNMTHAEAEKFRLENFNIIVELFKKEVRKLTSTSSVVVEKTEEEKKDFLENQIPKPVRNFEEAFYEYPDILEQIRLQKFSSPTPIQCQMWPILLRGLDCIGIAQTGTGKTLAFLLPALIHIDGQTTPRSQRKGPNVLVLSPTRELALQIEEEVKKINYKGIKSVCVYGGGDRKEQVDVCSRGVEIIIGTPGRLYDLIRAGVIDVTTVTYLVMDEADRMLDLGFEPQILKILLDIRPDRQTVMTSATWPEAVRRLASKYLCEPIQLYVGTLDLRAAKSVDQHLVMIDQDEDRKNYLFNYIEKEMDESDKVIVFVGRKSTADSLSCDLILRDVQCQSIHGDREQCDREQALEDFKINRVRILIATDVASRGIDVKDITCVFNYDFPHNMEEYVHRVGRTGRAGRTGTAITLMARGDWKHAKELIHLLRDSDQEVPQSLINMAERYEAMLKKREEEGGSGRGGGGGGFRRGGGGRGRGGFGGFGDFGGGGGGRGKRGGGGFGSFY